MLVNIKIYRVGEPDHGYEVMKELIQHDLDRREPVAELKKILEDKPGSRKWPKTMNG